jgi:hypothetical protein
MQLLPAGSQLNDKQREFEKCKEKYEKFKCDVTVKLRFLDENQVCFTEKSHQLLSNIYSLD